MRYILIVYLFIVELGNVSAQTSPYKLVFLRESLMLCGGIANSLAARSLEQSVPAITALDVASLQRGDVNAFDRWAASNYSPEVSKTSDYLATGIIIAPAGFLSMNEVRKDWIILSTMYAETMLWAVSAPSYAKVTALRIRPFVYNSDAPLEKKLNTDVRFSFFSSHACVAFASAVFTGIVFDDYFPDSKYSLYVWGCTITAASMVGAMRIMSGKHFPSDVIAGAAVGSLIGYVVPALHRNGNNDKQTVSVTILPMGISLSAMF